MPELPEVEIVARRLNDSLKGRQLGLCELLRPRLAPDSDPKRFDRALRGAHIRSVQRRGKNILFDLDNGRTLLTHLRMSGRFMLLPADAEDPRFTHAVFHLVDRSRLIFQDQRHFGLMKVIRTDQLADDFSIAKLAPEPFSREFSPDHLASVLRASSRSLKDVLLDQTKVCGLGNIYASEVMFRTRVSPRRRGKNVPRNRIQPLYSNILAVLGEAIAVAASKAPDPVIIGEGVYGDGIRSEWSVYEREGLPCLECRTSIRRIRQSGRSTYYCPTCQR